MRPLDPLSSIKAKLGVLIVASVAVAVLVHSVGLRAGFPLLPLAVAAAALGVLMVQFLARGMTSPLREMVAAAKQMARGDYSRRVTATSKDEVGDLARAFNVMAGDLAEVDRVRRDLVANVSHELRTPISALQAILENLVDGVEPPDPTIFKTMLKQTERLGRLVQQLLDLSRLESGTVPLQRHPFRVREVLDQAVNEAKLQSPALNITMHTDPADLRADGDPEKIHQVVANLIENAVRHSPADAPVNVVARGDSTSVTIEVCDEGPGIDRSEADRVFERFYRSDAARSSSGGAGLGLSIARWIVDLHGGDIRAEAAHPHGCRMVVALPKAAG